ncbi:MAG: hypothetical protein WC234_02575 [Endomicrobiaceae bacterium]
MSIFEIIMLLCFASAWPFSIRKSYVSKQNTGKSIVFLYIVLIGYIAGMMHKVVYNMDGVFYLYLFNFFLVSADMIIYYRNERIAKKAREAKYNA